ncbi:MAG: DUF1844 domain-containing protein [Pseudobdellovibrionaceae bacterium]
MSQQEPMQASFSMLIMSIASSAAMAMGLSPEGQAVEKDKNMARFNIDLLLVLKDKTKSNLSTEEQHFLDSVISDLQRKFLQI